MALPKYVERIARLPRVFELLRAHPDGVAIGDLARQIDGGVHPDELREDLLAFYVADVKPLFMGLSRPASLEFLGPDGRDQDPNEAAIVRIVEEKPTDELGVEYLSPSELALIYTAACALLEVEQDEHLSGAVDILTDTMMGVLPAPRAGAAWHRPLEPIQRAISERRKVRIVYSRSWEVGVIDRIIDPYLLVKTRRGWEIDAGPLDEKGHLRTYLVSNVRDFEVLDEPYDEPSDLGVRLLAQRRTSRVRVRIPHTARWAADFYAEDVLLVDDDEQFATLELDLLPPVPERVGRLLLACGPYSSVVSPAGLVAEGPRLAQQLMDHHRG